MQCIFHIQLGLLLHFSILSCAWQYFTTLKDYMMMNSFPDQEHTHSEYFYGRCKDPEKKFYTHIHKDHIEVLGKIIIRGWLDLYRIPTCIIIRASSYEEDMFRSTAYNFQICVPRITYCHSRNRFKYYYYEWYLPHNVMGGMNWDIYLYGPSSASWQ